MILTKENQRKYVDITDIFDYKCNHQNMLTLQIYLIINVTIKFCLTQGLYRTPFMIIKLTNDMDNHIETQQFDIWKSE